jgi:hypothetical protein
MEYDKLISGSTVTISATATAAQATLFGKSGANRLLVNNVGPNYGYFTTAVGSAVAQCSDGVIQAYQSYWVAPTAGATTVSAVCDSGMTAIFKITEGYGS